MNLEIHKFKRPNCLFLETMTFLAHENKSFRNIQCITFIIIQGVIIHCSKHCFYIPTCSLKLSYTPL